MRTLQFWYAIAVVSVIIVGLFFNTIGATPISESTENIAPTFSPANSSTNCSEVVIEFHCDQCLYFLDKCSEDDLSRHCRIGETSCSHCGSDCLNSLISNRGRVARNRPKRQTGPCIGIKGACGNAGHCCANLFCQSTSAGRGNRRKTCRP